jgi:hypothetical protein
MADAMPENAQVCIRKGTIVQVTDGIDKSSKECKRTVVIDDDLLVTVGGQEFLKVDTRQYCIIKLLGVSSTGKSNDANRWIEHIKGLREDAMLVALTIAMRTIDNDSSQPFKPNKFVKRQMIYGSVGDVITVTLPAYDTDGSSVNVRMLKASKHNNLLEVELTSEAISYLVCALRTTCTHPVPHKKRA